MILTDEDITEYQELVKKVRGIEITRAEALEDATSLIEYVRLTQKKVPDDLLKKYDKIKIRHKTTRKSFL